MKFEYFRSNKAGKIRRETADLPEETEHDINGFLEEYRNLCEQYGCKIIPYCDDGYVDLELRIYSKKFGADIILDEDSALYPGE